MTTYALVEELKQLLDIPSEDTASDVDLQRALDAASAWVDWFTGRTFGLVGTDTSPLARTYPAATTDVVAVIDLQSTAPTVEVDTDGERTFVTTLLPEQFALEPLLGPPYATLRAWPDPAGDTVPVVFAPGQLVRVTGVWGCVDARGRVPAPVTQGTLLLGARWFKRREAPLGVVQQPELDSFQEVRPRDPDVSALLFPLCLPGSPGASLAGAAVTPGGVYGAAWTMV